ncbi:MAG: hypothetical protein V9H26_17850 [Verrucomicrobiota bacterium]
MSEHFSQPTFVQNLAEGVEAAEEIEIKMSNGLGIGADIITEISDVYRLWLERGGHLFKLGGLVPGAKALEYEDELIRHASREARVRRQELAERFNTIDGSGQIDCTDFVHSWAVCGSTGFHCARHTSTSSSPHLGWRRNIKCSRYCHQAALSVRFKFGVGSCPMRCPCFSCKVKLAPKKTSAFAEVLPAHAHRQSRTRRALSLNAWAENKIQVPGSINPEPMRTESLVSQTLDIRRGDHKATTDFEQLFGLREQTDRINNVLNHVAHGYGLVTLRRQF